MSERAMATRCCSPARELGRMVVRPARQADFFEHGDGPLSFLVFGEALFRVAQRHQHIVEGACPWQKVEILEDEPEGAVAHPGPLLGVEAGDVPALQPVLAGRGAVETPEDVHERTLP